MDLAKLSLDNTLGALYIGRRYYFNPPNLTAQTYYQELLSEDGELQCTVMVAVKKPLILYVPMRSMYGVTTVQTYTYFGRCSTDSMSLKSMMLLLWVIDTLHAALVTRSVYTYLVTDAANELADPRSDHDHLGWYFAIGFGVSVGPIGISGLRSADDDLYGIAYAILGSHVNSWFDLYRLAWLLITSFAWSIAADLLIASSLCVLVRKMRTGYERSDNILNKIAVYSVNTGVLSRCDGVVNTVYTCSPHALACSPSQPMCPGLPDHATRQYTSMPDNFIFMACYCVYPKLVLNCLLATLNGRPGLQSLPMSDGAGSLSGCARPRGVRDGLKETGNKAGRSGLTVMPSQDMVIIIGPTTPDAERTSLDWLDNQVDNEAAIMRYLVSDNLGDASGSPTREPSVFASGITDIHQKPCVTSKHDGVALDGFIFGVSATSPHAPWQEDSEHGYIWRQSWPSGCSHIDAEHLAHQTILIVICAQDMVIDIGFTTSSGENTGSGWLGGQANTEVASSTWRGAPGQLDAPSAPANMMLREDVSICANSLENGRAQDSQVGVRDVVAGDDGLLEGDDLVEADVGVEVGLDVGEDGDGPVRASTAGKVGMHIRTGLSARTKARRRTRTGPWPPGRGRWRSRRGR
ncbi:hypothetical protein NUW54_g8623 [Trametes sanguinea]|uniref:Uncharacterized protein n=1 Tax=Trametes sanguinea TaxID=158606 RepID=A0ACC1PDS2_9APHY|nr:hypothetical protein NUW54_g8623 [Trametes sanguinea]